MTNNSDFYDFLIDPNFVSNLDSPGVEVLPPVLPSTRSENEFSEFIDSLFWEPLTSNSEDT